LCIAVMGLPEQFCASPYPDSLFILNRAVHPCVVDVTSVGLCLLGLVVSVLTCLPRLKHAAALKKQGQQLKHGQQGISGLEAGYVVGATFVAVLHGTLAISSVVLRLPPFHIIFHVGLCASWLVVARLSLSCAKVHMPLDFRPFTFLLIIAYCWSLETTWSLYKETEGFPLPFQRSTIWTLLLQTVVSMLLANLDFKMNRGTWLGAVPPEGYAQLAGGETEDMETGKSTAGDEQHSWIVLFWGACKYVWPEDPWLQARAVFAFILLLSMRFLNLAVPILFKHMVDSFSKEEAGGSRTSYLAGWLPVYVLLYLGAALFQGGAGGGTVGIISNLRSFIWVPVGQDAYRRISLHVFSHVMDLDLGFHLTRKTGEVIKQIERGTNAMQNILSTVMFSILPTCIDVLAASTYLAQALEPSIAITTFITVGSYIPITIIITEWRGTLRREMNNTDQVKSARATDALLNYETVKYFTNEEHERSQYARAIDNYQKAEFKSVTSINVLNTVQSTIMWVGVSMGLLVCSKGVSKGELSVGDVVLFLSLMAQLYAPLNFFGTYYRVIQQYMIDMENLWQLLGKRTNIEDKPGAKDLVVQRGDVAYQNVTYEYEPGSVVLQNVSFTVPGGHTIAFVGATGAGKSSITRLIFRFYDVTKGAVCIDGMDIRDVTQQSLRRAVGMVPQDIVLFNDTIMQNIRYGCLDASDDDVIKAAEAACIHEAITTRFPRGYDTVVGERGLRLSGGEKQRVAFARALLKNPHILVLDEATSALDTLTERKIQVALHSLRKARTTLIVAHRLSTIVDANIIAVLHLGEVAELGTHQELLSKGGLYADMWQKQLTGLSGEGSSS